MMKAETFLRRHPDIKQDGFLYYCRGSRYRVKLPGKLNEDVSRFIGIMHGDGNLSSNRILVTDKCLDYHQTVLQPLFMQLFNLPLNIYHDKGRSSYYSHIKSSIAYRYIIEVLEFKPGAIRGSLANLPSYLFTMSNRNRANYIAGLYDSEGHIKKRQVEIDFSICSKPIWEYITSYFREENIGHSVLIRDREYRQTSYEIYIYGKNNVIKFLQKIPIQHPAKIKQIDALLGNNRGS